VPHSLGLIEQFQTTVVSALIVICCRRRGWTKVQLQ
jgi:hypothetical protein